MNIPAMRTGGMKYVILRIDTHVLRIDLCPRKRTRIRRQKQDEDVHLFLSERPLPRQGSWPGASADGLSRGREAGRIPAPSSVRVGAYRIRPPDGPERGRMHVPNARTAVGAYRIRPTKHPARDECATAVRAFGPFRGRQGRLPSLPGTRHATCRRHF